MPTRKLPSDDILRQLLALGWTHYKIRDWVSEQTGQDIALSTVSVAISRMGAADRRPRYEEWLPWTVDSAHSHEYPAFMLRAWGRYLAAGRDKNALPPELYGRMVRWLAECEDQGRVVDYNAIEGFHYVAARPGEQLIRRPQRGRRQRLQAAGGPST